MTMTPWNLPHGQWSTWLVCGQMSWLNQRFAILTMEKPNFGHGHAKNRYFVVKFRGKISG